jgi:hypothetical protein
VNIVVGVSASDREFAILRQAVQLFGPTEVTLVHAVDLGLYFELSVAVEDGEDVGRQLLERAAATKAPTRPISFLKRLSTRMPILLW